MYPFLKPIVFAVQIPVLRAIVVRVTYWDLYATLIGVELITFVTVIADSVIIMTLTVWVELVRADYCLVDNYRTADSLDW